MGRIRPHRSVSIALIAAMVLACAMAAADVLHLTTGRAIHGQILSESQHSVTIETPEGKFTFPRQRVQRIEREAPAQNRLREVTDLLNAGQVDHAIALYQRDSLDSSFAPGTLESHLLNSLTDTATVVMLTSGTVATLADRLMNLPDAAPELLLFTAVQAAENRQLDIAVRLTRKIPLPLPRKLVWADLTIQQLASRLAEAAIRNDHGELIAASVELSGHIAPGASRDELLSVYAQIQNFYTANDFPRATALFRPELFLHRSDIFVPLAEKVLSGLLQNNTTSHGITALESARVTMFPYVSDELRRDALRALLLGLTSSGRMSRAQDIANDVAQQDADLGAFAQHLVVFQRRQAALPDDDPLEKYKLATWARTMGLLDESKALLLSLQSDPRFTPNVIMHLEIIETAQGQQELSRLQAIYKEGDYQKLSAECRRYLETQPPDQFAAKARDFIQLASFHEWNAKNKLTGQAEAEFQHAERLANRGDYDAALTHLNKLQTDLRDTAAAARAAALRNKILRAKMLSRANSETNR